MSDAGALRSTPVLALPRTHAEISQPVFLGVAWALVGLSFIFLLVRCFIKVKTFKHITPDDIIASVAWLMFLANIVIWTVMSPRLYENYDLLQGKRQYDPAALNRYGEFLHFIAPLTVLFYTSLWSVKLSLLLFFRKLGHQIRSHEIWWRCVTIFTVATWLVCVLDIDWNCTTKPFTWIMANCSTQAKIDFQNTTFYANCALDIVSDCLIISIPVLILYNTRVRLRRKLILTAIFSVTVIVMIVSVIRVRVVNSRHQSAEIAWLLFWSYVENGTAILISCAASFRQLFVASQERVPSTPSSGQRFPLRFLRSNENTNGSYGSGKKTGQSLDSPGSQKNILRADGIHVHSVVSFSSDNTPEQFQP